MDLLNMIHDMIIERELEVENKCRVVVSCEADSWIVNFSEVYECAYLLEINENKSVFFAIGNMC